MTSINDRIQIITKDRTQYIKKTKWPGSGNIGNEHLKKEVLMHKHAESIAKQSKTLNIPRICDLDPDYNFYLQEYINGSESIWIQIQQEQNISTLINTIHCINDLHTAIPQNEHIAASQPERPHTTPISIKTYFLLPIWGRQFIGRNWKLLNTIDSRIQAQQPNRTTFIHGDLSIDNILTRDNKIYIIDWERAGLGVPEDDLAALCASILSAKYYCLNRHTPKSKVNSDSINKWLSSWEHDVTLLFDYYDHQIDSVLFQNLVSAKILCRAYSRAIAHGATNALTNTLLKISSAIIAKPHAFEKLYKLRVFQ